MDNFSALLQLMNPDNTMSVNRYLAHSMGMAETIIYSALISKYTYYRDNGKASDGWFYSTIEDLQESTTYGRKIQTSAINKLVGYGLLESKLMGMPAKRYFRLISDTDKLAALIEQGQEICAGMRRKNDTTETEAAETAQNSSLSKGANKIVPMGQTSLTLRDKHTLILKEVILKEINLSIPRRRVTDRLRERTVPPKRKASERYSVQWVMFPNAARIALLPIRQSQRRILRYLTR